MPTPSKESRSKSKARILIVDDHPIVRHGLSQLIGQEEDLTVCGQAEDASTALEAIAALKPDVVVVDISLRGGDGIELVKAVKSRYGRLPVLVLTMHDDSLYGERALRAGARGYVMKQEGTERIVVAIRRVLKGGIYVRESLAERLMEKIVEGRPHTGESFIEHLSDRELEVFRLIGQGYKTRQIAEGLRVSVKTVEAYREHIKHKLNLRDATELLRQAIQWARTDTAAE